MHNNNRSNWGDKVKCLFVVENNRDIESRESNVILSIELVNKFMYIFR